MDFQLKNPASSPVKKIYFSKKAIQILLSLSVFSFLISQSLLHLFLSSFTSKVFSFSTERNYIFLLCNGVILVIIKTSGLSAPYSMTGSRNKDDERNNHDEEAFRNKDNEKNIHDKAFRNGDDEKNIHKSSNRSSTSNSVLLVETKTDVTKTIENENDVIREETEENASLMAHYEVKDEDANDELLKKVKEVEEQQIANIKDREEENEGLLSLEELNKKCEDFIRKMKHGIIIEDRQLIMV